MARFFKPLLGAVALAAAALTSTGAFAAYAYNAQISITAPKGSTAEAAAKNKSLPTGVKYSSCAKDVTAPGFATIRNSDYLQINVKYDAGKLTDELADVYVLLQNLSVDDQGVAPTARYVVVGRVPTASAPGAINGAAGSLSLLTGVKLSDLTAVGALPFLAKADNLGTGAQTEVVLGNAINLTGLARGLWSATVIIAKPGASGVTVGGTAVATASSTNSFYFGRPETWSAHDTVVFELGTPLALDATATLTDVTTTTGAGAAYAAADLLCQ